MLFKLILLLTLATIGSSFTFPKGLTNGIYIASYNDAGEEIHQLIGTNPFENATESELPVLNTRASELQRRRLTKRDFRTWCGCGIHMNTGDTNVANAGLGSAIASHTIINPGQLIYVAQNTVIAFLWFDVDSPDWNSRMPSINLPSYRSLWVSYFDQIITESCGLFIPGTARLLGDTPLDLGYMNYDGGLVDVTLHAEKSTQSAC